MDFLKLGSEIAMEEKPVISRNRNAEKLGQRPPLRAWSPVPGLTRTAVQEGDEVPSSQRLLVVARPIA